MATTKKAIYKVDNGIDFDVMHFETEASQVKTASGDNVEAFLPTDSGVIGLSLFNYGWNWTGTYEGNLRYIKIGPLVRFRGWFQVTAVGNDGNMMIELPAALKSVDHEIGNLYRLADNNVLNHYYMVCDKNGCDWRFFDGAGNTIAASKLLNLYFYFDGMFFLG